MDAHRLAVIAAASLAPGASAFGRPLPDHQVRPGRGAGGVRLGMSEAQVIAVLGRPMHRQGARTSAGNVVDLEWPGIEVRRWEGPGGRVIAVATTDRGIRLPNGIGVGSTMAAVRAALPAATPGDDPLTLVLGHAAPGEAITLVRFGAGAQVTRVSVERVIA